MEHALKNWLILHFSWMSGIRLKKLLSEFLTIDKIISVDENDLRRAGVRQPVIDKIKKPDYGAIKKALEFSSKKDRQIITFDHSDYPPLLKEIPDPPLLLYVWGDSKVLREPMFAVVGSRNPTHSGAENAFYFARELSSRGLVIASGLALGVDGQSHRGALEAKGKTVAVLGSGLEHLYPHRHRLLAEEIAEQGAVISELALDTLPTTVNFPKRNRIIAGMSMGTLIVEAALRSGSLITARCAMEQNREVFAIPGSIHAPQSKGCHAILKDGAKLTEDVDDILYELAHFAEMAKGCKRPNVSGARLSGSATRSWGFQGGARLPLGASGGLPAAPAVNPGRSSRVSGSATRSWGFQGGARKHPDPQCQLLLDAIGFDQASVDQLVSRLGLGAGSISALLVNLELQGYIKPIAGGYIRVDL
jgi:DNA processing protein